MNIVCRCKKRNEYSSVSTFTNVDELKAYILSYNKEVLHNCEEDWLWNDNNISYDDTVSKWFSSLEEAIEFAINYVMTKDSYCIFYNTEEHNITYEFINLETEDGIPCLLHKQFDYEVMLYYTDNTANDIEAHSVLLLNYTNAIKKHNEYKEKYNKVKCFHVVNYEMNFDCMLKQEKGEPLYIIEKVNTESGELEHYIENEIDESTLGKDDKVFIIDEVRLD